MDNELKMEYITITPEMDEKWLEKNRNRRVRLTDVEKYARDIQNGDWGTNRDPIAFSKDGYLVNGQHRLLAIIKSGISTKMLVERDVEEGCVFDTGLMRSAGDEVKLNRRDIDEEFSKDGYTSIARFMVGEKLNKRRGAKGISNAEIADYISDNICYFRKLKAVIVGNKKQFFNTIPIRVVMYSAVKAGIDTDVLHDFWKVLVYGFQGSEIDNPIVAYRNYVMQMTSRGRTTYDEVIKRGQYAVREYLNKTGKKRSVNPGDFIYPLS